MTNEELISIAIRARKNAFAPLTEYAVGAALLADSGTVYMGVNCELPSGIGISNCAERVAFQNALSHGERKFKKIAVVGGKMANEMPESDLVPCGVCLQYMNEMASDIDIVLVVDGKIEERKLSDFLKVSYNFGK